MASGAGAVGNRRSSRLGRGVGGVQRPGLLPLRRPVPHEVVLRGPVQPPRWGSQSDKQGDAEAKQAPRLNPSLSILLL